MRLTIDFEGPHPIRTLKHKRAKRQCAKYGHIWPEPPGNAPPFTMGWQFCTRCDALHREAALDYKTILERGDLIYDKDGNRYTVTKTTDPRTAYHDRMGT